MKQLYKIETEIGEESNTIITTLNLKISLAYDQAVFQIKEAGEGKVTLSRFPSNDVIKEYEILKDSSFREW